MKLLKMIIFLVITGILDVMYLTASGQEGYGTLRGRVSDAAKQTLPGATVFLKELKSGVVSDVNGFYLLPKIPAGTYHTTVSYVSYESGQFSVKIEAGKTMEKEITLKSETKQLQEVEVGGTFQGYQRAMNYQKNGLNTRNVVSADQVGRFPDANIGDAMKRIPGINVQYDQGEARFGQIRGTPPDFSSVTVNGNRLPSAEGISVMCSST